MPASRPPRRRLLRSLLTPLVVGALLVVLGAAPAPVAPRTAPVADPLDIFPPAVPAGLAVVGHDRSLDVAWSAVAAADLQEYRVYVGAALVATVPRPATSTTLTGLVNGTAYSVSVSARDVNGNESARSAARTGTPVDDVAPAPLADLVATRGDGAASLAWSATADPDRAEVRVLVDGAVVARLAAEATAHTATGLVNDRPHAFSVVAVDAAGNASAPNPTASATPTDLTPPGAPTGVTATPGPESATVRWSAPPEPDAAEHRVLVDGAVAAVAPAGSASALLEGLVGGRSYAVAVVAVDRNGNASLASAPVTVVPLDTTPPSVPAGVVVAGHHRSLDVSWGAVADADLRDHRVLLDGVPVAVVAAPATSTVLTGLVDDRPYAVAVTARDDDGNESAPSAAVTGTPVDDLAPSPPTEVAASPRDGGAAVRWRASPEADVVRYDVLDEGGAVVATATAPATSATVTGLANGTSSPLRVVAVDGRGNTSPASAAVTVTPSPVPPPSTTVPATGSGGGSGLAATRDGRWVVLGTRARLEAGDANSAYELHLVDRLDGTARRVAPLPASWTATTTDATNSSQVALSEDGRFLALATTAGLVPADANRLSDVYRLDLATGAWQLVSVPGPAAGAGGGKVSATVAGTLLQTGASVAATGPAVAITADGDRVLFYSARADLVAGDRNGRVDLFAKDLGSGAVTRVSVTAAGGELPQAATGPALDVTPDGRYALFPATGSSGPVLLLRKDLVTGAVTTASSVRTATGSVVEFGVFRDAGDAALSDDGRYAVLSTAARVPTSPGSSHPTGLAHRKDLDTGALVPLGDGQTTAWEHQVALDPTGRFAFFSTAAPALPGDANGRTDHYRRDLATGALVLVTAAADGAATAAPAGTTAGTPAEHGPLVVVSADEVLVTTAQPLVPADANAVRDVYRKDLATGAVGSAVG